MRRKEKRLNNPFNIKNSPLNKWQGKISSENDVFESYASLYAGYRAFILLISNYNNRYGLFSIEQIINRYAPSEDNNNTKAYISFIVSHVGNNLVYVSKDYPTFLKFAQAVAIYESSHQLFEDLFFEVYHNLKITEKI